MVKDDARLTAEIESLLAKAEAADAAEDAQFGAGEEPQDLLSAHTVRAAEHMGTEPFIAETVAETVTVAETETVAVTVAVALTVAVAMTMSACRTPDPTPPTVACPVAAVRVHAQRELDALRGCATLPALELRGAVPFDLSPLERLTRIDGDLGIGGTFALGSVTLPALAHVGGALRIVTNLDLGGVYLSALASAGSITITDAPPLLEIMLPALIRVDGDLTLARLPSLELVDVSTLPGVGGTLSLDGAPRLATWLGPTEAAVQARSQP